MASHLNHRRRPALMATLLLLTFMALLSLPREASCTKPYEGKRGGGPFMLKKPEEVVRTEAGTIRVVKVRRQSGVPSPMHIGFIDMEPNSLFLPLYLDSSLLLFVRTGELRVGRIYEDDLVMRDLRAGDVYQIPSGTAFYMVNVGFGQRVHVICSIDTTESLGFFPFMPFFVGGGVNPPSVLSGFDTSTLSTAFNVSRDELRPILERQTAGPIIPFIGKAMDKPSMYASLLKLKYMRADSTAAIEGGEDIQTWAWNCLHTILDTSFGKKKKKGSSVGAPDAFNLYDKGPDFQNAYGSKTTIDEHDYQPLNHSSISVFHVNLAAGSMLVPHLNPKATVYGVVLNGSGVLQMVFPNGTSAMKSEISEGDGFLIPRYFPFTYMASRSGPLEIFGFTTSSRKSQLQYLVGAGSVLHRMKGPELAASFGVSQERMERVVSSQGESYMVPAWAEPSERRKEESEPPISGTHAVHADLMVALLLLLCFCN